MAKEKADGEPHWNRYLESLRRAKVPERARRWYVLRVEQYLKAHADLSLPDHGAALVTAYLSRAGRDQSLAGWQFYQVAHALGSSSRTCLKSIGLQILTGSTGWIPRKRSSLRIPPLHDTMPLSDLRLCVHARLKLQPTRRQRH
ncbi:MAG TPA: hypothetical protein VK629_16400 [Steroidobacteraceae bacterium]|nr:hypothetical protein [Steroidobacteraceae bacterium]